MNALGLEQRIYNNYKWRLECTNEDINPSPNFSEN